MLAYLILTYYFILGTNFEYEKGDWLFEAKDLNDKRSERWNWEWGNLEEQ